MANVCGSTQTKTGSPCKKRTKYHSFCYLHKTMLHSPDIKHPQIDKCSICLDEVPQENDAQLVCGHAHHLDCVSQLRSNSCPVCRQPLKSNKLSLNVFKDIENRKESDLQERRAQDSQASIEFINNYRHQVTELMYNDVINMYNTNGWTVIQMLNGLAGTLSIQGVSVEGAIERIYRDLVILIPEISKETIDTLVRSVYQIG